MTQPTPQADAGPTRIPLYPLTFVDEGDQVIIGRPDVDSFAVFPADAAAVVRRLELGDDLATLAAWYEAAYGEPADIADFVDTLRSLGFVRPDGEDRGQLPAAPRVRWQRLSMVALSRSAMTLYALAVCAAICLVALVPGLRPTPSKVFFSTSLLVVVGASAAAQLIGIALHEGAHVLAGRRLGLASRLSVGRRLTFVVFETTLVGLMGVPSRKRILPFCAGLVADALFFSLLIGLAQAGRLAGWPFWVAKVAIAFAYVTILRMLWQAMIFMETDLYHVLASALKCPDLHRMTRTYLRNRFARLRGRKELAGSESGWTVRDLRIVRRYARVVLAGSIATLGLAAASAIPVLAGIAVRTYRGVTTGSLASPRFWDSLVVGAAIMSQFALVAMLALRDRRRRPIDPDST